MSDIGVNWLSINDLSDAGINWVDVDVMSDRGINWLSMSDNDERRDQLAGYGCVE